VAKDEELRSPKAITFIYNRSNPNNTRLNTKNYSKLRTSPQVANEFLKQLFYPEKRLNDSLIKQLGDKKWIK
jgi:hypothetical protein